MSLFSAKAINEAVEENKKAAASRELERIPKGANTLVFKAISLEHTQNNAPYFKVIVEKPSKGETNYKPITNTFMMIPDKDDPTKVPFAVKQFIKFFQTSFGYTITPSEDLADVLIQVKPFETKKFRGVVRWGQKAIKQQKGGYREATVVELYYTGLETDPNITPEKVNVDKCTFELSPYDRDLINGVTHTKGGQAAGSGTATTAQTAASVPTPPEEEDDLPF